MTASADAATDTATDTLSTSRSGSSPEGGVPVATLTTRIHAWLALAFLVVGMAALLAAYAGVAWPSWMADAPLAEHVTYGRAMPMAINALVFGWVTLGLLAGLHHFVPRLVGSDAALGAAGPVSGLLITAGVASGIATIAMGEGAGGRLLEMPWYSDLLLLAGFLLAAIVIGATVGRSEAGPRSGVALWYAAAAPWWLFLSYGAGAIPGLTGVDAELQSAFSSTAIVGMWLVPAAVGLGYALVKTAMPDARFHPRLGRIGFWSLGALWAWTAASSLQYGPTADWIETIPVLFALGLVVAVAAVVTDFAIAVGGRLDEVAAVTSLRYLGLALGLLLVVPVHILVESLRASSAVIRFTGFEAAFDLLILVGVGTLFTAAAIGQAMTPSAGRRRGGSIAAAAIVLGTLFAVGTRWVAGLQQGYSWLGGVESDLYVSTGDGFRNTVEVLHGTDVLTFIGLAVAALGVLVLVVGMVTSPRTRVDVPDLASVDWPDQDDAARVRRGAIAVFASAFVAVLLFPALDSTGEPTLLADSSRDLPAASVAAEGRDLYVSEGCWYCHTQQVRAVVTDLGLGPVSAAGDFVYDPPGTLGVARLGPDLAHAGTRAPTDDPEWIAAHLADPRAAREWSTMPSYGHLSSEELTALAVYVAGLE